MDFSVVIGEIILTLRSRAAMGVNVWFMTLKRWVQRCSLPYSSWCHVPKQRMVRFTVTHVAHKLKVPNCLGVD